MLSVPDVPVIAQPLDIAGSRAAAGSDGAVALTPPDLILSITARPGGRYAVSVATGTGAERLPAQETDDTFARGGAQSLLQQFRTIRASPDVAMRQAHADRLGEQLWDILPSSLREYYWREMHGHDLSLLICSDEPSLPWELVKPRPKVAGEVTMMLGRAFAIARWRRERALPAQLEVSGFAAIAPKYGGRRLPGAKEEIERLTKAFGAREVAGEIQPVNHLLRSRGDQLIHFSCHGTFDPAAPDDGQLVLSDGALRPADVRDAALGGDRAPLVFLNACQLGNQGWSSAGVGGWATAFGDAGCAGFIGPYWSVTSLVASRVSVRFYEALGQGLTLGQAMRAVRERFTTDEEIPGHPTWLAYTFHGHPNATVRFPES